jgi:hypothetical protein
MGRRKKEEGRRKKEEGRDTKNYPYIAAVRSKVISRKV